MLTREQNETITRTDPGTPMGKLMRRYWMPFAISAQLPGPDCPPIRVRLLGERLVAFRNSDGQVGLLNGACPHRKAELFFGRNEENGLRCVYHGWKFDVTGQCVDMPSEPVESNYKDKVRTRSYPVIELGDVLWAYMGPPDQMPPKPDFEWTRVLSTHRAVSWGHQNSNWLQGLEGGIDSAHSSFLHNNNIKDTSALRTRSTNPTLEVRPTDFGYTYASIRHLPEDEGDYVRAYQFVLPFHQCRATQLPGPAGAPIVPQVSGHMWVPMDDENTLLFNWTYTTGEAPLKERAKYYGGKQIEPVERYVQGLPVYERRWENDYLIDREEQRDLTFTGISNTTTQDRGIQETMGAIVDRTDEHLGTSDRAIIAARKMLLEAVRVNEDGGTPKGVRDTYRNIRAVEKVLPKGTDWFEALRSEAYESALP
jgi:phenylpropionate dioxygenase-like ring-hydroxylating dioxygenase large terminal subunit